MSGGCGSGGPLPGAKAVQNKKRKYVTRKTIENLPDDLKEEIFKRLDVASWGCCKAVCRRWRELLANVPAPTNGIPCQCDISFETREYKITNFFERTVQKEQLPPQMLKYMENAENNSGENYRGYRCMGSFGPWLILIIYMEVESGARSCLYNPLSLEYKSLPEMYWTSTDDYWNVRARMSCIPSESNLKSSKCWVVVFTFEKFYACKPDDDDWMVLPVDNELSRVDATILFRYGRPFVYLVDVVYDTEILVCDVEREHVSTLCPSVEKLIRKFYGNEEGSTFFFNLAVDSSGNLIVVGEAQNDIGAKRIVVLKLQGERLVRAANLGGGMIFIIGDDVVFHSSRGACESGLFVKDCVYYLSNHGNGEGRSDDCCEYIVSRFPVNQPSQFTLPRKHSFFLPEDSLWFMPMIS